MELKSFNILLLQVAKALSCFSGLGDAHFIVINWNNTNMLSTPYMASKAFPQLLQRLSELLE